MLTSDSSLYKPGNIGPVSFHNKNITKSRAGEVPQKDTKPETDGQQPARRVKHFSRKFFTNDNIAEKQAHRATTGKETTGEKKAEQKTAADAGKTSTTGTSQKSKQGDRIFSTESFGGSQTLNLKELLLKNTHSKFAVPSDPQASEAFTREQSGLARSITGEVPSLEGDMSSVDTKDDDLQDSDDDDGEEGGIKSKKSTGGIKKIARRGKSSERHTGGNKINYFFNPMVSGEEGKETLQEYIKTKNQVMQRGMTSPPCPEKTGSSGLSTGQTRLTPSSPGSNFKSCAGSLQAGTHIKSAESEKLKTQDRKDYQLTGQTEGKILTKEKPMEFVVPPERQKLPESREKTDINEKLRGESQVSKEQVTTRKIELTQREITPEKETLQSEKKLEGEKKIEGHEKGHKKSEEKTPVKEEVNRADKKVNKKPEEAERGYSKSFNDTIEQKENIIKTDAEISRLEKYRDCSNKIEKLDKETKDPEKKNEEKGKLEQEREKLGKVSLKEGETIEKK